MQVPRVKFTVRIMLLLPVSFALLLVAIGTLTARPSFTVTGAAGIVEPVRTEEVKCPLEGRSVILSILPEGTLVKKGQLVCELDSSRFRDQLAGLGTSARR